MSAADLSRLAGGFGTGEADFIERWCRWVPYTPGRQRLSLREKPDMDCVLWDGDACPGGGCRAYRYRPLQCRAFPFWESVVASRLTWERAGADCPGINTGKLRTREEIDAFLDGLADEPVIERRVPGA